jgi:hypothetical protein
VELVVDGFGGSIIERIIIMKIIVNEVSGGTLCEKSDADQYWRNEEESLLKSEAKQCQQNL